MITETLNVLRSRIQEITNEPVYIMDSKVAVYDKNVIYIVSPSPDSISIKPLISCGNTVEYTLHIYEVVHVSDISRQRDIKDNIVMALDNGTNKIGTIFDKIRGYRTIAGANVSSMSMGTDTWVVNTTVYTVYDIRINLKTIKDI